MKRIIAACLVSVIMLSAAACSEKPDTDEASKEQSAGISEEPSAEESSRDEKELLRESFGKLFEGSELYIRASITVESGLSGSDINSYELTAAADKNDQKAMILMTIPGGQNAHVIVRNNYSYQLDDEEQTYKKQLYAESVKEFITPYTKELYLGVTDPLIFEGSGSEEIDPDGDGKKESADYLKFRMSQSEISADRNSEVYITYYFVGSRPVMEIMEKTGGKTTFVFKELSDKIADRTIFDIDEGYTEE